MHNASTKCYVMNETEEETGFYSNGMIENISFLFNEKISVIRRVFWGVLISIATFYSIFTIMNNCLLYLARPTSIRTVTHPMSKMNMTNIYICLNSQHSMWRIKAIYEEYPDLVHLIPALYGNMQEQEIDGRKLNVTQALDELSHVSLNDFLEKTAAEIVPLRCRFNMQNCPQTQYVMTRYGRCLFYNLETSSEMIIAGPQSGLVFYGAYNKSDQTTGALQFVDGLSIFYGDGDEELMLMKQRTTALPDLLSQISLFRHEYEMKSKSCAQKELYFFREYSYEKCQMDCKYHHIIKSCECRPPYIRNPGQKYQDTPECSFLVHAKCVTKVFFTFNYQNCGNCPKDCEYKSYVRSVEYAKYHQPIHKTLDSFRSTEASKGIDVAAFQVFFPTLTSTVHKEEEDYTAQQFFSELGGAAGLVLGISLISIISKGSEKLIFSLKNWQETS